MSFNKIHSNIIFKSIYMDSDSNNLYKYLGF